MPEAASIRWSSAGTGGLGPVDQDPDQARTDACDLLSPESVCHPTFETVEPSRPPSSGGSGAIVWLLLAVGVAFLVALIVRAIAGRVRDRRPDEVVETGDEIVPLDAAVIDPDNSPGDWRSRSQRHRAAGEHRDALRCEYRALVGDLARRNLLDEIPGRTAGEERAQLRRTAPVATAAFGAAVDLFERVWYGSDDATAEMLVRFDAHERDVLAATSRTRRSDLTADA
jgi:hypothetical protein